MTKETLVKGFCVEDSKNSLSCFLVAVAYLVLVWPYCQSTTQQSTFEEKGLSPCVSLRDTQKASKNEFPCIETDTMESALIEEALWLRSSRFSNLMYAVGHTKQEWPWSRGKTFSSSWVWLRTQGYLTFMLERASFLAFGNAALQLDGSHWQPHLGKCSRTSCDFSSCWESSLHMCWALSPFFRGNEL